MITQKELKEILHYDPGTGIFRWISRPTNRVHIGDVAGSHHKTVDCKKYIVIRINHKAYKAHRLAFLYMTGSMPLHETDHIYGDGLDNRWSGLRQVTRAENMKNKRLYSSNTSSCAGVSWDKSKDKWKAQIVIIGKNKNLGSFDNKLDAITARKAANIKYQFHANHGQDRPL